MKYLKAYDAEWDEFYQVALPSDVAVPLGAEVSGSPFLNIPERPRRSREEADKQRAQESPSVSPAMANIMRIAAMSPDDFRDELCGIPPKRKPMQ